MMTSRASDGIRQCLETEIVCPICTNMYDDPRSLPCIHTYCLKCVKKLGKGKSSGDGMSCPECRKGFLLPENGADGLPKNFFILRLMDIVNTSDGHCEECIGDRFDQRERNRAVVHCIDCRIRLCEVCIETHRKVKSTQQHRLVKTKDHSNSSQNDGKTKGEFCSIHPNEELKLHCFECQQAICTMCFVTKHRSHETSDVSEVAEELRKQMTRDIHKVAETIAVCREIVNKQEEHKEDLHIVAEQIKREICERADQLKLTIDMEKNDLLEELSSRMRDKEREIDHVIDEVIQRIAFSSGFLKHIEELRTCGTALDLVEQAGDVHERAAVDVTRLDEIQRVHGSTGSSAAAFEAAELPIDGTLVGKILWQNLDGK